jgi:hypothetical protein
MRRMVCVALGVIALTAGVFAQTSRPRTPPPAPQPGATRPQPPPGGVRTPGQKPPEGQRPARPGSGTGQNAKPRGGRR